MCEQKEMIFFKTNPPPLPIRKLYLDPKSSTSPYYGFIGNSNAIRKLSRIDLVALGRFNHNCSDLNIAILGYPGCGKTDLVKRHAAANQLPLVEIHPKSIRSPHQLFLKIQEVCKENGIELVEYENNYYVCPPINVFIDEVHSLMDGIVQSLLKATEQNDRMFVTEEGVTLNCKFIHWIIATTERGKLFDAFDTRFSKIKLNYYNKKEIEQIVVQKFPELVEIAGMIATYCPRIPREALSFAKEMILEKEVNPTLSWHDVAAIVAEDNEIDQYGMSYSRLRVLVALSVAPISSVKLPSVLNIKKDELENFILPFLLEKTEEDEPYITTTRKGYCLTEKGKQELIKRGLPFSDQ